MARVCPPPRLRSRATPRKALLAAAALGVTLTILAALLAGGLRVSIPRAGADVEPAVPIPSVPPLRVEVVASPSALTLGNTTVLTALLAYGTPWYSFVWAPLPPGCATKNLSSLNCTPTTAGTYQPGVTVTDSTGQSRANATTLFVNSSQAPGSNSGSGSPLSGATYLFAGLVGIGAAIASTLLILLLTRRRRRRQPPIPFSQHPYVPPLAPDDR